MYHATEHDEYRHCLANLQAAGCAQIPDDASYQNLARWLEERRLAYREGRMEFPELRLFIREGVVSWLSPRPEHDPELETRLIDLQRHVTTCGWLSLAQTTAGALDEAQIAVLGWLEQLDRQYAGQELDPCLQERFALMGVRFQHACQPRLGATLQEKVFNTKLSTLWSVLDHTEQWQGKRDLRRRNLWRSARVMAAWQFVEHILFKARNGILPARQRERVMALRFSVEGVHIRELLSSRPCPLGDERGQISASENRRPRQRPPLPPHLGGAFAAFHGGDVALPPGASLASPAPAR